MSNIFFINLHASMEVSDKKDENGNRIKEFDPKACRFMILNTIRSITSKYKFKYGEVVFACDAMHLWRKDEFKPYKAHRKKDREQHEHIDWTEVFKFFDEFKKELRTYTKYKIIEIDGAEGDDVISTLAIQYGTEPILVVSTDKDLRQLQMHGDITIYDPKENKVVPKVADPLAFLQEHIINGDRGDGIPNILSDDDTFLIEGQRQGTMTATRLDFFKSIPVSDWDTPAALNVYYSKCNVKDKNKEAARDLVVKAQHNFWRNKKLIDLREVPFEIQEAIIDKYKEDVPKGPRGMFDYFYKFGLTRLMESINDF